MVKVNKKKEKLIFLFFYAHYYIYRYNNYLIKHINMKKQIMRITEQDIKNIVSESVNRIIAENADNEGIWDKIKGGIAGAGRAAKGEYDKFKRGAFQNGLNNEYQGQNLRSRFDSAKNHIKYSAKNADSKAEINKMINQIYQWQQSPYMGPEAKECASQLISKLQMGIRGANGNLSQNFSRNYK